MTMITEQAYPCFCLDCGHKFADTNALGAAIFETGCPGCGTDWVSVATAEEIAELFPYPILNAAEE